MPDSTRHVWPLDEHELRPALRVIATVAHADMAILMLHDDAEHVLHPVLAHGLTDSQRDLFGAHRDGEGPFATALTEHRLVRVRNAWQDHTLWAETARRLGFRHIEILPFFRPSGEALGVFAILYRTNACCRRQAARIAADCANIFAVSLAHAHEHLRAEHDRAQIAKAAQGRVQFVARMSHELRTPLQSIAGYVNLLQTGRPKELSEDQARMLDRIVVSERILVHLIDDLISFSRMEAGDIIYRFAPVSATTALQMTEGVLSPLALQQKVSLQLEPAPPNAVVHADAEKLQQVLVNLAANAIKYSPPGATVTLRCRNDADCVAFDVVDNGPGIPAEKLSDIFEPYVRLESPATPRSSGWGLGLAISRELAAGMHGSLTVQSDPGRGSAFTLRLPRDGATDSAVTDGARTDGGLANSALRRGALTDGAMRGLPTMDGASWRDRTAH